MNNLNSYTEVVEELGGEYNLYPELNTADGVGEERQLAGIAKALFLGCSAILSLNNGNGKHIAKVGLGELNSLYRSVSGYNVERIYEYCSSLNYGLYLMHHQKRAEARYYELQEEFGVGITCERLRKMPFSLFRGLSVDQDPLLGFVFHKDRAAGKLQFWDGVFLPEPWVTDEDENHICNVITSLRDVLL